MGKSNSVVNGNSKVFLLILLGMLAAFGPFVTDMYLPGLPSMTGFFDTTTSMVQLGLTSSMAGMAVGQLIFGALSDKYGRRRPLLVSMGLFVVSTVICIFSPNIEIFVLLRLLQGISAAGGIVMSRCVATDLFAGHDLVKMLAVVGAINGVAPIAAPIIGGIVMNYVDWRGVFVILLVIGALLTVGCIRLKESLPPYRRTDKTLLATFKLFAAVLKNRKYRLCVTQQAFAMLVMFANISSSPFIIQQHYGYSALFFSVVFAINAVALALAAVLSVRFCCAERGIITGTAGMVVAAIAEMIALVCGVPFWIYEALVFVMFFMLGLTLPLSTTLAMDNERDNAGSASAVLGALLFLAGGVISPLVGLGDILISTGVAFVVGSLLSMFCALGLIEKKA